MVHPSDREVYRSAKSSTLSRALLQGASPERIFASAKAA